MSRLLLSTAAAALLAAAPLAPVAMAAPQGAAPARTVSDARPMEMAQANTAPASAASHAEMGDAQVKKLNQKSLQHAKTEAKSASSHKEHAQRSAETKAHGHKAMASRKAAGQTRQGDAAVESLNEQSLSRAKAGQSAATE